MLRGVLVDVLAGSDEQPHQGRKYDDKVPLLTRISGIPNKDSKYLS